MPKTHNWQPITGCSHYSAGCANCKTMQLAPADLRAEMIADGLMAAGVWTGKVRFSESRAMEIAALATPTTIFVCPFGDLFNEAVPQAWIDRLFAIMEACPGHTFQILTKRAERQCRYVNQRYAGGAAPKHIAVGVSVERQREADERLPWLRQTAAAARYMTAYPVLDEMTLGPYLAQGFIAAVGAGDEKERPARPEWIETIRTACARYRVPFVFSSALVGEAA